jgi:folate-binding protein YgfZ
VGSRENAATGQQTETLLCEFLPWGDCGCTVLATTGSVELEYAAIRKSAGVFDAACRGSISLTGADSLSFAQRMTTQQVSDLEIGASKLAFVVDRKGRIIADVLVVHQESRVLIDCDVTVVASLLEHFEKYIVADDVVVENVTQSEHRLWVLGPQAVALGDGCFSLPVGLLGIGGIAMTVHLDSAEHVWMELVSKGVRPIGWYALNMVRVEEHIPMFRIDYDTSNLPHETSSCDSRVRFDKGCYLGQEVVARMESLGGPKQGLVCLELQEDALPIAGTQIWDTTADQGGKAIGVVTSSATSPMRGGDVAVIAMIKNHIQLEGSTVYPWIGSEQLNAVIRPLSPKDR